MITILTINNTIKYKNNIKTNNKAIKKNINISF